MIGIDPAQETSRSTAAVRETEAAPKIHKSIGDGLAGTVARRLFLVLWVFSPCVSCAKWRVV